MGEGDREVISYRFYSNHLQKKMENNKRQTTMTNLPFNCLNCSWKSKNKSSKWFLRFVDTYALEFFALVEFFKQIARDEISWCSFSIVAYLGLQQCLQPEMEILKYLEILQISFNFRIMHNILSSTVCIQNIWLESVFLREAVTSLCQFLRSKARGGEQRGKSKTSKGLRLPGWLPNTRLVFPVHY